MSAQTKYSQFLIEQVQYYMNIQGEESAIEYIEENYRGEYETLGDYADEYLTDTGGLENVPDFLLWYINFEAFGRDLEIGGDIFTIEEGYRKIHVFFNGY